MIGSSVGAPVAPTSWDATPPLARPAAARALFCLSILRASQAAPAASDRKGSMGMPGRRAMPPITAADMPSAFG